MVEEHDPDLDSLKHRYLHKHLVNHYSLLSGRSFYVWANPLISDSFEVRLLKIKIEGRGGTICEDIDDRFDYIVLLPNNTFLDNKQIEYYLNKNPNTRTTTLENLQKVFDH
jgi:hypothetical protein